VTRPCYKQPMKIKHLSLFFLFLLPSFVFGQDMDSASFHWKTFLSRNFNPAISVGVGGGQVYHTMPTLSVKIGRLSLSGVTYNPFMQNRAYSYQVDLELARLPDKNRFIDRNSFVTLSAGLVKSEKFTDLGRNTHETLFALTGINRYLSNERSKMSLKVGVAYLWTNTDVSRYRDVETHDWIPYGELSYKLYLFKMREKQKFKTSKSSEAGYLAYKKHKREITPVKYPNLSKWFNPYWSHGIGLDRVLILPAGGLKVGLFNAKFSAWVTDLEVFWGSNLNFEIPISKSDRYSKYISMGVVLTGVSGADCCSGASSVLVGGVTGLTFLRNHGRHGIEIKAGFGKVKNESWSFDLTEPFETHSSSSQSILPILGFSYNLYFFRFSD
jgi:hypothetical protein